MTNSDAFVIRYDTLSRQVHFSVHKLSGIRVDIADGEPLKEYDNTAGLFSLEGHYRNVFDYITENFDGSSEVALKIETHCHDFDTEMEFIRFEQRVKEFNKTSDIKLNLIIKKMDSAPIQPNASTRNAPSPSGYIAEEDIDEKEPTVTKQTVKVAVAGRTASGKTVLIEGLTKHNGSSLVKGTHPCGEKYVDKQNNITWYEITEADFGGAYMKKTMERLESLIETEGVTAVLYCFSAMTGKMEDAERDIIVKVKRKYRDLAFYAVITRSIDDNAAQAFTKIISNATMQTKVFTVLSEDTRTYAGYIEPYGLDELSKVLNRM